MRRSLAVALVLFSSSIACAVPKPTVPPLDKKDETVNERVRKLFASMRDGTYIDNGFPKLGWEDVPSLMVMAESTAALQKFPQNIISSYCQRECAEGIAALWLIEGVRKGSKLASLNPLILPTGEVKGDWEKASIANYPNAVKAYKAWWDKAAGLSREKAAAIDPLKDAQLHWH